MAAQPAAGGNLAILSQHPAVTAEDWAKNPAAAAIVSGTQFGLLCLETQWFTTALGSTVVSLQWFTTALGSTVVSLRPETQGSLSLLLS